METRRIATDAWFSNNRECLRKFANRMTMTNVASDMPKAFEPVAGGGAQRKPPVQNGQADGHPEGVRAQSALLLSLRDKTPKLKPTPKLRDRRLPAYHRFTMKNIHAHSLTHKRKK